MQQAYEIVWHSMRYLTTFDEVYRYYKKTVKEKSQVSCAIIHDIYTEISNY